MDDHPDLAAAIHPIDLETPPVADKSDDKRPGAVPHKPPAADNKPEANNRPAAGPGKPPVLGLVHTLEGNHLPAVHSKSAVVAQTTEPVRRSEWKSQNRFARPHVPEPPRAWPPLHWPATPFSSPLHPR